MRDKGVIYVTGHPLVVGMIQWLVFVKDLSELTTPSHLNRRCRFSSIFDTAALIIVVTPVSSPSVSIANCLFVTNR